MSSHQRLEGREASTRPRAIIAAGGDTATQALVARLHQHPPGVLAVLTRDIALKDFTFAFRDLLVPVATYETSQSGGEKVDARNRAVEVLRAQPPEREWLYQLDDDHNFLPTVLLDQLDVFYRERFDVLGVIYPARLRPDQTYPIGGLFNRSDDGKIRMRNLAMTDLPAYGEVLERRDLALGTSGLLVHRRVFDTLEAPYFRVGQILPEHEHEDLEFSVRCQEAGLKVGLWLGPDGTKGRGGFVGLGHVARCTVWLARDGQGAWGVAVGMDQKIEGPDAPRPGEQRESRIVLPNGDNRHERRAAAALARRGGR
jgi:hypothetical protein